MQLTSVSSHWYQLLLSLAFCVVGFAKGASAEGELPPSVASTAARKCNLEDVKGVEMTDGTVCFHGLITPQSSNKFLELATSDTDVLVISSNGGDVSEAIKMANRMVDLKMSVVVVGWCMSSCANYIFPAARQKYVMPRSYIGWHGGPPRSIPDGMTEKGQRNYKDMLDAQSALFSKIGVSESFIYDHPMNFDFEKAKKSNAFWTYSPAQLRCKYHILGIMSSWLPFSNGDKETTGSSKNSEVLSNDNNSDCLKEEK